MTAARGAPPVPCLSVLSALHIDLVALSAHADALAALMTAVRAPELVLSQETLGELAESAERSARTLAKRLRSRREHVGQLARSAGLGAATVAGNACADVCTLHHHHAAASVTPHPANPRKEMHHGHP